MRLLILFFICSNVVNAQININDLRNASKKAQQLINSNNLTDQEITEGLKEALSIGIKKSSYSASKKGGFNENNLIRIPFPNDAIFMKNTLIKIGLKNKVNEFEYKINETAEKACLLSYDVFYNTVIQISFDDALEILNGEHNAATNYLRQNSYNQLYNKFIPIVTESIKSLDLNKYWEDLKLNYNKIPLARKITTDLNDFITRKAIDGLFHLIEKEEQNIRENPSARITDILKRVFN